MLKKDTSMQSSNKPSYYVNLAIMIALMALGQIVPPSGALTELGVQCIFVIAGMLWGWLFVGPHLPTILGFIILGLLGYDSVASVFRTGFGHNTVMQTLFMMCCTGLVRTSGATKWVAYKIVYSKIAKGKPYVLTFLIFLATFALSSLTGATPVILLMWSLAYDIFGVLGYKCGEKWPMMVIIGICLMPALACQVFPFQSMVATIFSAYETMSSGATINAFLFFVWQIVTDFIIIFAYLGVIRFIAKPDVSKIVDISGNEKGKVDDLNRYQIFTLVWVGIAVVAILFASIAPSGWALTALLKKVGNPAIFAIFFAIFAAFNFKSHVPFNRMVSDNVVMSVIFVIAGGQVAAAVIQSADTGIQTWMVEIGQKIVGGQSYFVVAALILALILLITNFCNNIATATIFSPIVYTLCTAAGLTNMAPVFVVMTTCCAIGLISPSGSANAALMHGNKEWIPGSNALKWALVIVAITLVVEIAIGLPLAMVMF